MSGAATTLSTAAACVLALLVTTRPGWMVLMALLVTIENSSGFSCVLFFFALLSVVLSCALHVCVYVCFRFPNHHTPEV